MPQWDEFTRQRLVGAYIPNSNVYTPSYKLCRMLIISLILKLVHLNFKYNKEISIHITKYYLLHGGYFSWNDGGSSSLFNIDIFNLNIMHTVGFIFVYNKSDFHFKLNWVLKRCLQSFIMICLIFVTFHLILFLKKSPS